eukprot:5895959-Prymnesium_polylepis.2
MLSRSVLFALGQAALATASASQPQAICSNQLKDQPRAARSVSWRAEPSRVECVGLVHSIRAYLVIRTGDDRRHAMPLVSYAA